MRLSPSTPSPLERPYSHVYHESSALTREHLFHFYGGIFWSICHFPAVFRFHCTCSSSITSVTPTMGPKHNHRPIQIALLKVVPDHLTQLPKSGHRYLSDTGRPLWDNRYHVPALRRDRTLPVMTAKKAKALERHAKRAACPACIAAGLQGTPGAVQQDKGKNGSSDPKHDEFHGDTSGAEQPRMKTLLIFRIAKPGGASRTSVTLKRVSVGSH